MPSINTTLNSLGFSELYYTLGRASVADLFRPGQRCGVYVLHFINGEFYCGQSVDVTRRYVEHSKIHADIEKISFKQVSKDELNAEEMRGIHELETVGFHLRNIALTSIPYGPSDLDLLISEEGQNKWHDNLDFVDHSGTRPVNPELRRKYQSKYEKFIQLADANEIIEFLRVYAHYCIPAVLRTEISFWSCSCLPGNTNAGMDIFTRVNIYWQEVLTIGSRDNIPFFSFHLAKAPFLDNKLSTATLRWKHRVQTHDHQYQPGGQDQINLVVEGTNNALTFINNKTILQAIRLFNIRLMQKGACTFGRYHCLDLADQIVPTPS